jgi:L-aspartate oxidase
MINKCDVLIVGGGLAGLYAALSLETKFKVTVLTKGRIEEANSYLAQGGIAAAIDEEDNPEDHFRDTLKAGAGLCDLQALNILVTETEENINNLMELGVVFDQEKGRFALTMEGGHSRSRILHIDGDATGKGLMKVLIQEAYRRPNIKIIENSFCKELIVKNKLCLGAVALEGDKVKYYVAKTVILATGGIGQVYGITSNSIAATGDAIAMAYRVGAEIIDMEFIQFHPTVFYSKDNNRFLISEAVRGEGAILRNILGERFMEQYDKRLELAPRDIVARAIVNEMKKTKADFVFLDLNHLNKDYIVNRFPNITAKCKEYGIDITTQMIPVAPAQHYCMGGIKTDLFARTNISRLYACGETACTGVHGANRLASNSLLEAIVFAKRASRMINSSLPEICINEADIFSDFDFSEKSLCHDCDMIKERRKIQNTMREYAGVIRSKAGLLKCQGILNEIEKTLESQKCVGKDCLECNNILTTAKIITQQSLNRKESIGAHYIAEFQGEVHDELAND